MKSLYTWWDLRAVGISTNVSKENSVIPLKIVETAEPHKNKAQLVGFHKRVQNEKIFNSLHSYLNGQ